MRSISDDDLVLMYREGDTEAFNTLFDRYYAAVYNFEQMRYTEIAEVLEMPLNTVKTLIHRARGRLAAELEMFRKEIAP